MADFSVNIVLKARDENSVATIRTVAREYRRAFGQMVRLGGRSGGFTMPMPGMAGMPGTERGARGGRGRSAAEDAMWAGGMHRYAAALGGAAANMQRFTDLNKQMLRGPIEASMEFEHAMKTWKSVSSDATVGNNMDLVTAKSRELGATTEFTAAQVAEGFKFMGIAGFDTNKQLATISPMLDAATFSGAELGRVSDIVTDVLSSFGYEAGTTMANGVEASRFVIDSMVATAKNANTNFTQLGEGMFKVGPLARKVGIEFNEVSAMMGILANSGFKGAEGGTALRNIMLSLSGKPTKDMRKLLKHLGIGTKELRAELGKNGLEGAMRLLMTRMTKMSPELQLFASNVLFNRRTAAPALTVLAELDKSYDKLKGTLDDSAGTSEAAAAEFRSSNKIAVEELKSAIDDLAITLGDHLWPILRPIIKDTVELVNEFGRWAKENPELAQQLGKLSMGIVAFGTVVAPVLLGASALVSTLGHARTLFALLGPAAAGATPGLVGVGGAAAGASAGVASLSLGTVGLIGLAAGAGVAIGLWADETFQLSDALAGVNRERAKIAMTSGGQVETRTGMVPIEQLTPEEKADLNVAVSKRISLRQQMEEFESTFSFGGTEDFMGIPGLLGRDKRDVLTERMNEQSEAIAQIHARARARQRKEGAAEEAALAVAGPLFGETPTGPLREPGFNMVEDVGRNEAFAQGATRALQAGADRGVVGLLTQIRDELRSGNRVEVKVSDKKTVAVERGVRSGVSPSGGVS